MTISEFTAPTVTADPHKTTDTEMNTILANIASKINEIRVVVNGMVNPSAPDLSGYATTGQLTAHKTSYDHTGHLEADGALAGRRVLLQKKTGTLAAGTASITWDTSYATGALLFAWVLDTTATPAAIGLSAQSTTGATVKGTGTNTFTAFAVGYI